MIYVLIPTAQARLEQIIIQALRVPGFFHILLGMSDVFYGIIYKFVLFLLEIVMSEDKQMTNSIIPGG